MVPFVQSAIQDVHDGHQEVESAHMENGEGVECIPMSSLWEDKPDNDLVVYLCSLLLSAKYNQAEVAILLETVVYTVNEIQQCKQIIAKHVSVSLFKVQKSSLEQALLLILLTVFLVWMPMFVYSFFHILTRGLSILEAKSSNGERQTLKGICATHTT